MQLQFILYVFPAAALIALLASFVLAIRRRRAISPKALLESMQEAIIVLNAENRVVDLNPSARQLIKHDTTKVRGQPLADVFSSWPELVKQCSHQTGADDAIIGYDGDEPRSFHLNITLLHRKKVMVGRLIILRDITERMRVEMALKESEGHFRNIFAEVPIGIVIVDLEGHILQVNKAFCEMLEYSEPELIGLNLSVITHPDDIGADGLFAGKALSGEMGRYKVEKRYIKKNNETLWVDLTATILRDQKGEAIYGLVMLENIIERKRARLLEEERYHVAYELHDGLAQVAVSVHQHLQALASHYHPRSPQARQDLSRALELAQLAVREARRLIAGLRPTVLDDFGLAMALRLQVEAQRNDGWTIVFDDAFGPGRLPRAIETTLFGVVQEALTNIRKHSHTKRARLALERHASHVRLEVQDWGCGFEPRTLFKVYRPGEHVGIRAMQERVELLGGHLLISSHPGFGTLVVAEVPLLLSHEQQETLNAAEFEAEPLPIRDYLNEREESRQGF